jgi:transcriptional regulator with XRE-family HTH domain
MNPEDAALRAGSQLRALRRALGISQRVLADSLGLDHSVVSRAERGLDAQLTTWTKLFWGLGYEARFEAEELGGETGEFLAEESERRRERRFEGLCAGKRRW